MITAEQKQLRSCRIGSSDAPAVVGLDPNKSAADVWLEKTGQADGFEGNAACDRGNWMEPALLAFAHSRLPTKFVADRIFIHPSDLLCANLDAITEDETEAIEAKSTVIDDGWGEDGTDQVPERVMVQTIHQFVCVPTLQVIWVPMVIPKPIGNGMATFDWRLYRVDRDAELVEFVESAGINFMEKFVKPMIRPDEFKPSVEVLRRVRREPNKEVPIADELVDALIVAKAAKKQAIEEEEIAYAGLLESLGDAECGVYAGGKVLYQQTKRKGYTVEATTYRQLRIKPRKGE